MPFTRADKFMDFLDEVRRGIRGWLKSDPTEYFPIISPHNHNVLALHNGSLMSVIRIDGYMGQYFPDQFTQLREKWIKFFQTASRDKSAKGFDLFWSYEFDPEGMKDQSREYRQGMIKAAERRGMNVRDIIEEEADVYGAICANEQQYLFIVTHIDSLIKSERSSALKSRAKAMAAAARGADAMPLAHGIKAIEAHHEQHVNKVSTFLHNVGMKYTFERLNCYEALWVARNSYSPSSTSSSWRARLTMRDCRFRPTDEVSNAVKEAQGTDSPADWTFVMPKPLRKQMVSDGVVDLGQYAVVDDRIYAPMYVDELAVEPKPLEDLLTMCYQAKLPIRIVYSLMANSEQANYWNRMFASIFTFASASNRQINKADKAMKAYQENNGAIFGYGISLVTWAKTSVVYSTEGKAMYDVNEIAHRARNLETYVQQWGGQQLDRSFGDSVEAVMDATPGYSMPPSCPKAPQIELDVVSQLPIMRPARLWDPRTSIWFRTKEGVLAPFQPYSKRQSAMLYLVLGGMGYGKSNLLSELTFFFGTHPEAEEIPYIRMIDFGKSASGVVGMIRDELPPERQHEVIFDSFTNDGRMVKNMLDTRPGLLYPLEDHRKFLVNWLLALCASTIEEGGIENVVAVLNAAVLRVYQLRDPNHHTFEERWFNPLTAHPIVLEKLESIGFVAVEGTHHYWEITRALLDHGLATNDPAFMQAGKIAQRYAVPQYQDLIKAVDQLKGQFKDMPDVQGRPLPNAIVNSLVNANGLFKCFSGVTTTDISESRVCVLDMSEVFGRGESDYDKWQRSVLFAVVYRLLNEDLFINKKDSGEEISRYQSMQGASDELVAWHHRYLETQDQSIKCFLADELHRLGRVAGAFEIIDSMAYEGRKYKVGIVLGTQMPQHFPPDMLRLATSIFIFGASQSSETAENLKVLFDLTDDETQAVLDITPPNAEKGAEVFVIHKVDTGIQRLKLHFHMGNIKRWAYATEPEERGLRDLLYKRGPSEAWARRVLATHIQSADKAIKRKQAAHAGDMSQQEAIKEIAEELLRHAG
jgi:intracellular multiplication protein IcmB